ncbi:MAG TPA: hypothetical protein VGU66_23040 [Candidatus Elarobacter sp.]|nr:hypothetical protein [Candidatus Elarobacter sp.]
MNEPQSRFDRWGATGANVPDLSGGYNLPPGNNGDVELRSLVAAGIAALYSAVGSAQRAPRLNDDQRNAVHQLLVANGCLAASEADAFLNLISCGLEKPA